MNIVLPPEVGVEPYGLTLEAMQAGNISQYTTLFREDTAAGELLGMALDSHNGGEPLRVISAGCSYGAEVDTVLALAHYYTPDTRVAITGVDANPAALVTAQRAQYRLQNSFQYLSTEYGKHGLDFGRTMSAFGIGVVPYDIESRQPVLRTAYLRRGHDVDWREGNLATDRLAATPAHLIMCNNVLCYYRQDLEGADAIAMNLGSNVAIGGLLSFGANLENGSMDGWAKQVRRRLSTIGLEPVETSNSKLTAFQRTA